jgi:hypothetical protein
MKLNHLASFQASEERVNEINERLREARYTVDRPTRAHRSWT